LGEPYSHVKPTLELFKKYSKNPYLINAHLDRFKLSEMNTDVYEPAALEEIFGDLEKESWVLIADGYDKHNRKFLGCEAIYYS